MRISAIILAAGASSRMGQAKQLLPLAGSTVLAKTIENVRLAAIDELLVVLGASAEAIRLHLPTEGLKLIFNPDYQQGMATSLRAGLAAVEEHSNAALIVLGDQPFIRPGTLDRIVEEYRRTRCPNRHTDLSRQPWQPRTPGPLTFPRGHGARRRHRLPGHLSQPRPSHRKD